MDHTELKQTILDWLKKYRWAAAVLLAGLLLMAIPEKTEQPVEAQTQVQTEETLQQSLETMLSRLDGAGKVKVLLSTAAGEEVHYQTDEDQTKTADTADKRVETVIITGSDRAQQGLVQRIDPPKYLGAVVLCQGADSATVKLAIVEAVATITGLTSDKITVLKMK